MTDFTDELGNLLYQEVRLPGKRFRQRRPDGRGGWIWDLEGVRRVLCRLPAILRRRAEPVWVTEGCKDMKTLEGWGLLATTNAMGAGKWFSAYSRTLAGRDVIMTPDNDEAGEAHAERVLGSLLAHGVRSVRIVRVPGDVKDVTEWAEAGGTLAGLLALAAAARGFGRV